jgi:uncharacterized membrane protein YgdD (TMEM256/DUF423 family)
MSSSQLTRIAAVLGALAVGLGAFGAHALRPVLESKGTVHTWETAVFYHFLHTLALLFLSGRPHPPRVPVSAFLLGIFLFSGSLYVLCVTGVRWLGAITPFGGVAFIVGWTCLAICRSASSGDK